MLIRYIRGSFAKLSETKSIFHAQVHSVNQFSYNILVSILLFNEHITKFLINIH